MEATQAQLLSLLDGKKQFIIPIYQRTYSWKIDQCRQLLKDILRVGQDNKALSHFIGSIVYFKPRLKKGKETIKLLSLNIPIGITNHSDLILYLERIQQTLNSFIKETNTHYN